METHDQKTLLHSGHDGQVHLCHKCGWPYPKPHPSSRQRRAHKRVCGTLDGYPFDNNSHLDLSDDADHLSDDENKTPGSKVVERTISRKSSSGVGSQSTRSEDEVFADAVTYFADSPGLGEASYGVISRGNSLLNMSESNLETPQLIEKNADGDKELPTVNSVTLEGDLNEMKAMLCQDHISRPNNNVDDSGMEEHKLDALSKETVDQRIPSSQYSSGVVTSGDVSEVSLDPVTVSQSVEVRENETTQIKHVVDSPRNFQDPEVVESAYESAGKVPDAVFKECNSITDADENVNVVAVPDALCLQENPDIAVENLDHIGGNFNIPMDSEAALTIESLEFGKCNAGEESYTSAGFAKPGESNYVSSVGDAPKTSHSVEDVADPELGPNKSMVKQHTVGQEVPISDVRASDSDNIEVSSKDELEDIKKESGNDQEFSSCTEQVPIVSSENLSSKDASSYDGDDQEMTAKEDVNTCDDFKHGGTKFMVDDHLLKVSADELAVTSPTSAETFELTIDHGRNDVSYNEKVEIDDDTASNGSNVSIIRGEEVTEPIEARTISGNGDKNDEFFELDNEYDKGEVSNRLVSENEAVGDSQPESLPPPSLGGVGEELQGVGDNMQEAHSKSGVEKSDEHIDSVLKTSEDTGSCCPSSDVVTEQAADNVATVTEDAKITKKHSSVLVPNTSDSSTLTLNWGSVSVVSATSDASSPVTHMALSKNLKAMSEEATVSWEPKEGPQHCEKKTGVESQSQSQSHPPVAVEESAGTSEIQAQQNEQEQSHADGSHIVSHVVNGALGGKKEKEIMGEANNDWDSGKQHTALKTLLGEAIAKSRAESPNHDDSASVPHKNNDVCSQAEKVTLVSKDSKPPEIDKEWNSPARYPVNIKTEKKRAKNRSYWIPFLCCSSVNAR